MTIFTCAARKRPEVYLSSKHLHAFRAYTVAKSRERSSLKRRSIYISVLAILTLSSGAGIAYRYHDLAIDGTIFQRSQSLNPSSFTAFTLTGKDYISAQNAIFTFAGPMSGQVRKDDQALNNRVLSVEIKQPQLQISRAYSPLPSMITDENCSSFSLAEDSRIQFLIKKEQKGEVSRYLHKLPIGSQVEIRGPKIEYSLPEDPLEVIFIAGGTGIAPALQVAKILHNKPFAKMHILWANKKEEELTGSDAIFVRNDQKHPVVARLENLKDQFRERAKTLSVEYYVDEKNQYISSNDVKRYTVSKSNKSRTGGIRLILVSGPDGFVERWAGPKVWKNGQETQGQLGGLLGQINLKEWHVWKL